METGNNYIAHFRPMELTAIEGVPGGIFASTGTPASTTRLWNTGSIPAVKPYEGGRAGVFIPFSVNGQIAYDQLLVTLRTRAARCSR